jgi:hypothetical protein
MKRDRHAIVDHRVAIGQAIDVDQPQARLEDANAGLRRQIVPMADARMVAMGVCDHGTVDRPPWVDIEVARHAVQTFFTYDDHIGHGALS